MSENVSSLFTKAKNGNVEAFEKLIESYEKLVFNVIFKATGNGQEAAAIAQKAFVDTYRGMKSIDNEVALAGYIYRSAGKACAEWKNSQRHINSVSSPAVNFTNR